MTKKPKAPNSSGVIKIDGKEYKFEVIGGRRFINGVDAQKFIGTLPRKTLLRIVAAGMNLLNEK